MKTKQIFLFASAFMLITAFSLLKDWKTPQEYKIMKNPTVADKNNLLEGKDTYNQVCASCHGQTGKADGKMSAVKKVTTKIGDAAYLDNKTDGELYYMMIIPDKALKHDYSSKIPNETDRWYVVNYMRTFKAK